MASCTRIKYVEHMFYIKHVPTMVFYLANQYATYAKSFRGDISC